MATNMDATAASLSALGETYRTITSNLANASTSGYKRRASDFVRVLNQQQADYGPLAEPTKLDVKQSVDYSQGMLNQTGRKLDVALNGPGFLALETPKGLRYTRNGQLRVNSDGFLVTIAGDLVSGDTGPISVPSDASTMNLNITREGKVFSGKQELGQLRIVEFAKPHELKPVGGSCFEARANAEMEDAVKTHVCQGFQENSNVNIVEELVDLIKVSRLYEANMKTIKAHDDRMKDVIQAVKQ